MAGRAFRAEPHTLSTADGSATYTSPTESHTIVAGVNYPLEVPYRSDEVPDSTYIQVNLRPHNAVGMVKERHVEELVRTLLQSIVLGEETPRCMLQVTLQVMDVEVDEKLPGGVKSGGQGESYLEVLVGAINATVLGCLDAGVKMRGIAGAVLVATIQDGSTVLWPDLKQRKLARALHGLAYGREGQCLLIESEGAFDLVDWEQAETAARRVVIGKADKTDGDVDIDASLTDSVFELMRRCVETRVTKDTRWITTT